MVTTFVNPTAIMETPYESYLALGDSYTIGESVADTEKFPLQTARLLREQNIHINDPDIVAVTGWTTGDLLNALNAKPPKKIYSFVSLLIGVNNQYQGMTLDDYRIEFAKLLNMCISYAGNIKSHVFVLSIPDYSSTPFAKEKDTAKIAREIDAFNFANKTITNNAGVHYLDITPRSREVKNTPALIAADGLHPSAIQYKEWSRLLARMILNELQ